MSTALIAATIVAEENQKLWGDEVAPPVTDFDKAIDFLEKSTSYNEESVGKACESLWTEEDLEQIKKDNQAIYEAQQKVNFLKYDDIRATEVSLVDRPPNPNKKINPFDKERLDIIKDARGLKTYLEVQLKAYKKATKGQKAFNKKDYINHIEQKIRELSATITKMQSL